MKEKSKAAALTGMTAARSFIGENRTALICGAVYAVLTALFGGAETFFETAPLGLALLCAVREGLPVASLGFIVSALIRGGDGAVMNISGAAVALGFRYALSVVLRRGRLTVFGLEDGLAARISASVAGGFTVSLIRIIYGGFRYYDLLAAVFYLLCAAGATYAYSGFLDRERRESPSRDAGIAAIIFSSVLSLAGVTVAGISLSLVCAFALTLAAARRKGALYGVVAGFLCGAAADLSLCPMFGVTGFLCGLLSPLSAYIGVLFSLIAGLFCGLQTGGFSVLTSNMPEAAVAACLVLPAEYFGLIRAPAKRALRSGAHSLAAVNSAEAAARRQREDLTRLSAAFSGIASAMSEVSASEKRLTESEALRICDGVMSSFCGGCEKRFTCYPGKGAPDPRALRGAARVLCSGRQVGPDSLPSLDPSGCPYGEAAAAKLNITRAGYEKHLSERDRAGAASYNAAISSRLVSAFAGSFDEKYGKDEQSAARLRSLPAFRELFHDDVSVCGGRMKYVTAAGVDAARINLRRVELCRDAEKALSMKLCEPRVEFCGDHAVFTAERAPEFDTEHATADAAKLREKVNGDASFSVSCGEKRYFTVCDGMGSGADAASSSRLAGVVLGRLLYAGASVPDALDALNGLMRQRRTECFSTVDVLEFDLLDGSASFYKCGACPSFILRDGKVYRIASRTPPVGIMENLSAERIELRLRDGDLVLMTSDGAADQTDHSARPGAILAELDGASPEQVCEAVLEDAARAYGGADDVTVLAVKIRAALTLR